MRGWDPERLQRAVTRLMDAQREAMDTTNQALEAGVVNLDDDAQLAEISERLEAALEDVQAILEGAAEDVQAILEGTEE